MKFDDSKLVARLDRFTIETPSWGYADTGTRFGKFLQPAAAVTTDEKLADAGQVHRLTGCCPNVALHVLWDFPYDHAGQLVGQPASAAAAVKASAAKHGVRPGSINPNLFQDQRFKLGSVTNTDPAVRRHAIAHLLESVHLAAACGSDVLSLWFADGTNYPAQGHLRQRRAWMEEALRETYAAMPAGMTMLIEYKPFEPAFYHTDIADWGMAASFARACGGVGGRAKVLVDTGHHLPGANIEHIVAFLLAEGMLGGFHFNDRKYADDDLTMGSIDPYQLFRIFSEIVSFERDSAGPLPIAYMIDQSHNLKPKIEAMIQTVMIAQEHFAKALLVDFDVAAAARERGDIIMAEQAWKDAYSTDVRGFLAAYRRGKGLPEDPLLAHRESGYEAKAAAERGIRKKDGGGYT